MSEKMPGVSPDHTDLKSGVHVRKLTQKKMRTASFGGTKRTDW